MSVTRVPTYGGASDAGGQAGLNSLRTFWVNDTQESLERRFILQEDGEPYGTRWRNDGMPLHPEPTDDPLDPLNWTSVRKHTALAIVMWLYFMFTYITTTTVPSFPGIQRLYGISYSQVNLTVAAPSLGLALGPLLWSSLADKYGRRIVFIFGTSMAFAATIGTAISKDYITYMVARFFQGLGSAPGGTVGMAIIGDLFFEHERGQKLGLWVLAINSGLLVGPIVGGFVDLIGLAWIDWLTAISFGLLLVAELAFLPETLYPRDLMLKSMRNSGTERRGFTSHEKATIKRTRELPFINIRPIPGTRSPKPWDSLIRFFLTFRYPVVVVTVVIYCFSWYWWVLSIITLIPTAYAQYSPQDQGLLFIGLLVGTAFAELFCSGRLSDWLIHWLSKRNRGIREPEMRLWLAYPGALLSAVGLLIWGLSIENQYPWVVGQVAFFLFAMGIQMGNTVISSYVIDCYPLQSMSIITFYSVFLDLSAFINPFFIFDWVSAYGYTTVFTIQGIVTFCVAVPVIGLIHVFGAKLRRKTGNPPWVNPEYDSGGVVSSGF